MTKQEFETRINGTVTATEYSIVEYVYTFHPSISNTEGKEQIASIYKIGGMRLIKDMIATAQRAEHLENEIRTATTNLNSLKNAYKSLKEGMEDNE